MSRVKRTENCFSHDIKQLDSNWERNEITSAGGRVRSGEEDKHLKTFKFQQRSNKKNVVKIFSCNFCTFLGLQKSYFFPRLSFFEAHNEPKEQFFCDQFCCKFCCFWSSLPTCVYVNAFFSGTQMNKKNKFWISMLMHVSWP